MRLTEEEYAALLRKRTAPVHASEKKENWVNVGESKLERRFGQQLAANPDLPAHQRNYFFLSDRDLEFDFCWPEARIAVEVQGTPHRIKGKYGRDIEKRALAMLAGWRVLEVDGPRIKDGTAMVWLRQLLGVGASQKPG